MVRRAVLLAAGGLVAWAACSRVAARGACHDGESAGSKQTYGDRPPYGSSCPVEGEACGLFGDVAGIRCNAICTDGAWAPDPNCKDWYPTSSSASGGPCNEVGTEHCRSCLTKFTCGTPNTNATLLVCNQVATSAKSSFETYSELFSCFCGADGTTGKCGGACPKSCTGTGTDSASCMSCLASAFGGTCADQYKRCNDDS
jgi:hypothetical protein